MFADFTTLYEGKNSIKDALDQLVAKKNRTTRNRFKKQLEEYETA